MLAGDEVDEFLSAHTKAELERQLELTRLAVQMAKMVLNLTPLERVQVVKALLLGYLMDVDLDEEDAAEVVAEVVTAEVGIVSGIPALLSDEERMTRPILERLEELSDDGPN